MVDRDVIDRRLREMGRRLRALREVHDLGDVTDADDTDRTPEDYGSGFTLLADARSAGVEVRPRRL